eukprot:1301126-Prymnesium_polylepis.1
MAEHLQPTAILLGDEQGHVVGRDTVPGAARMRSPQRRARRASTGFGGVGRARRALCAVRGPAVVRRHAVLA